MNERHDQGPSPREIEQLLRGKLDMLAPQLLAGAVRDGQFWCAGSVQGEAGQSLKLNRTGPRRGCWTDFSAAEGSDDYSGDMLKLIAVVHFGGWSRGNEARSKAIQWAKSWLGLESLDRDKLARVRREASAFDQVADEVARKEAEGKLKSAKAMWHGAVALAGTPAEAYLRGRGIDFERLGRLPGALRYLANCWCPLRRGKHPAMVAAIYRGSDMVGVHRTYLDVSGGKGGPVKAVKVERHEGKFRVAVRGKSHKLSLGDYLGGCIVLWKGGRSSSLADVPPGTPIYVSEGIEDGLSVAVADPSLTVVAGVALANMGSFAPPSQAGPIIFIGQNDPEDSKAVASFERALARQQAAAREAGRPAPRCFFPKPQFKDFNDQLTGKVMA
jgi:hypothetical protein